MSSIIRATTTSGLQVAPDNSGSLQLQTNGTTTAVTIDTSQNVGIGTTSPTALLTIGASSGTPGYNINYTGSPAATIAGQTANTSTGELRNFAYTNYFPTFYSNNAERMRIDSNGRIQINDTTPVSGFTAKLTITSPTASESNITLKDSGTTYATGTQYISFVNSSNASSGSIQHTAVTTVAYATASDSRLKENIVNAPNSLDTINGIKIRSFDWKEDKHHTDYGLIAQELYQVFPEAVLKGDDGEEITNPKETWQVEYGRLTPLLVKAIQEQQTIINDLKARVTALEVK